MASPLGASAYVDVPTYLRAPTGQETASLLGLDTTIAGSASLPMGMTTLPVASSLGWATGPLWLLDGPSSEVAQVSGAPDATHLTLAAPGTQLSHDSGISASQAGASGALAEVLLRASAWIEGYCQQGGSAGDRALFAISRTERWGLPGPRAWLDRDGVLSVRPGHFPVQSVSALSVESIQGTSIALDATQLQVISSGRLIEAPLAVAVPSAPNAAPLPSALLTRARRQWVVVSYLGGIMPGAVPYDVQQACIWVASELLAQRRNPSGAAAVHLGKFQVQQRPRTDPTADSLLLAQARLALEPYRDHSL